MTVEEQAKFMEVIEASFTSMKNMLDIIKDQIAEYPVFTQMEFIKPIQYTIVEAFQDATNEENSFLNNYDGGDKIEVSGKN